MIHFTCNICNSSNEVPEHRKHRELLECATCGSTPRYRGIFYALQKFVLGSTDLHARAAAPSLDKVGIGMSDSESFAPDLARLTNYRNTYFHQQPKLDVTNADSCSNYGNLDFVICSEILEHIISPVSQAMLNIKGMLRPSGCLILSVPYLEGYETIEHYPHIHNFAISETSGHFTLTNISLDGHIQHFDNLVFHGGPGSTLEMRVFGEGDLLSMLSYVGFKSVEILEPIIPDIGYVWDYHCEHVLWKGRRGKHCILVCNQ